MGVIDWKNIKTRSGYTQPGWCSECEQAGVPMRYQFSNMVWHAFLICPDCSEKLSGSIAREELTKNGLALMDLPVYAPDPNRWERVPPCPRCGQHPQMGKIEDRGTWVPRWYCRTCSTHYAPVSDTQLKAWHRKVEDLPDVQVLQLRAMEYGQYLETRHWREISGHMRWYAGNRCQLCGTTGTLNVHHNSYARKGCERPEDLVVLCRECHEKHHGILAEEEWAS